VNVSPDLHLLGSQSASSFALVRAFGFKVYSSVACGHNSVVQAERAASGIVEERLLSGVGENTEARLKDGLGGADVPHCVAWHEVHEEVTVFVCRVEEFVDVLEDSLLHVFLLCVRSKVYLRLEVARSTDCHFSNVCERWNISW